MDDGAVPLHAYHDEDEDRSRIAQTVNELIHLAQEVAENPTAIASHNPSADGPDGNQFRNVRR